MNSYEIKQENRKKRFEKRAEKARQENVAIHETERKLGNLMPLGQPILVDHHSAKATRAHYKKMHNLADKACEAGAKAKHYERKAASVGKGGISSDDPDAVDKLKVKLNRLKEEHELMKRVNKAYKAYKKNPDSLKVSGLSEKLQLTIRNFTPEYSFIKCPFPTYTLSNSSANIKRIEKRIEELSIIHEDVSNEYDGFTYAESDNRIQFIFDGKPEGQVRAVLKKRGFKWSPSRGAWVRKLTGNAKMAAKWAIDELKELSL